MEKRKKIGVGLIVAVLIIVGLIGGWYFYNQKQWEHFSHQEQGISFDYPKIVESQSFTAEDTKDHIIFRGITPDRENVSAFVTVRYEDGLGPLATYAHTDLLTALMDNTDRAHPMRFDEYEKISSRVIIPGPHGAGEVIFSYTGPAGERITQRFMIILKDDNTAFYIAAQTKSSDFEKVNKKYFDRMFESVTFEQ